MPPRFSAGTRPVSIVEAGTGTAAPDGERTKSTRPYPRYSPSTRSDQTEFKAGKLSKVTFKYGFPQYNKPAAAASKQLGIKVGKEHETVVLTKGKDGKDQYKVSLQSRNTNTRRNDTD